LKRRKGKEGRKEGKRGNEGVGELDRESLSWEASKSSYIQVETQLLELSQLSETASAFTQVLGRDPEEASSAMPLWKTRKRPS
jgi:hypothetical protein